MLNLLLRTWRTDYYFGYIIWLMTPQVRYLFGCVSYTNLLTCYHEYNELTFLNSKLAHPWWYDMVLYDTQNETGCNKWFAFSVYIEDTTYPFLIIFYRTRITPLGTVINSLYTLLPHAASGQRIPLKISFNGIF